MSTRARASKVFMLAVLVLTWVGCTANEEVMKDPLESSETKSYNPKDHEFVVDKNGLINFKAEIVYFNFDDYTLTEKGQQRLAALADYMTKHNDQKINIAGHSDNRGSIEYNLALGQLRARTVQRYLAALGISDSRLATISFGEERPAIEGQDENAYQQNRRAEFQFVSE